MRGTLIIKDGVNIFKDIFLIKKILFLKRLRLVRPSTAMNELDLVHHTVQFHSHFPPVSNTRPFQLVSLVQLLERELNNNTETKHRILLISDNLLHIDNKQLRVSIESNGEIDIAWTLNVCKSILYSLIVLYL